MRVPLPLILLVGCAEEPVEPGVLLGTGEITFEPLVDEVLVVHGPQGGYHLVGSVRTRGLEPGDPDSLAAETNPTVTFAALFGGVDLTLTGSYRQGLDPVDADGWTHEMVGRLCILDITDDDEVAGQDVLFSVEVTPADGAPMRDERTLRVRKDPRNL